MENFYTLLSNTGINAIIAARASNSEVKLTKIAVGDGDIIPSQDMTALKSEKHRFNINSIIQDIDNPNYLIVEGVIPSNIGGFYVSEVAIYTDQNTLFAIGSLPKTYKPLLEEGSAKDLTIKIFLEITNADSVTLKVDDSVVLATRKFVLSELKKYALINGDKTKRFKVADAVELNEAINKKQVESYLKIICPASTVLAFATNIVPTGFLECNGAAISRTVYAELFSQIGTIYGSGNGSTTFNIPDMRDRFPRGRSSTRAVGLKEEDSIQSHNHYLPTGTTLSSSYTMALPDALFAKTAVNIGSYESPPQGNTTYPNSSYGAPDLVGTVGRFSDETRPKAITLLYCIKY